MQVTKAVSARACCLRGHSAVADMFTCGSVRARDCGRAAGWQCQAMSRHHMYCKLHR